MRINPTLNQDIIHRLRFDADRFESVIGGPGVARFLVDNGRAYDRIADELPKRGTPNVCYYNAISLALDAGLTYVEGMAIFPGGQLLVEHAWCVDAEDQVHDPTWEQPGLAYFGVPFAIEYVRHRLYQQYETRNGLVGSLISAGDDEFALLNGTAEGWKAP